MRYNKRQKDERRALARRFEQSELSKTDYARQHGLSVNSLNYWIGEATKEESRAVETAFYEIKVTDGPVSSRQDPPRQPDLEVELPLGVKLRFFGAMPK